MSGIGFMRGWAILSAVALAGVGMASIPASGQTGHLAAAPRLPKKQQRAIKRQKYAEPEGGWPRSKNPPTKRRLKGNRLLIGKRVRRKHRRQGKRA